MIRWSYGYQLLQKHEDDDNTVSSSSTTASVVSSEEYLQISDENRQLSSVTISVQPDENTQLLPKSTNNQQQKQSLIKRIFKRIDSFMSPPLYAAVIALTVGLSPLKPLLYNKDSFLYPSFTKAIESCGKAAVPIILTCLGAQLVSIQESQHDTSPEMKKPVAIAILVRMFLMPFLVVPTVVLFVLWGSRFSTMATDPVFITMMIVLGCSPTAINLVQITQVNHIFEEEMLHMLFWSYGIICVPVCTFVVFLSLSIVDKLL